MKDVKHFKKGFSNYWYYYKYHTIAAIFIIFLIVTMVTSSLGNVKDDLNVDYIGNDEVTTQDFSNKLTSDFSGVIKDINKDGKVKISFQMIYLSGGVEMTQKAFVEISASDTTSFIVDKETYLQYAASGAFQPLDDLAAKYNIDDTKYPSLKVKDTETGESHIYAVPLEKTSFLSALKPANMQLYYGVRSKEQSSSSGNNKKSMYENSMLVAENLAAQIK